MDNTTRELAELIQILLNVTDSLGQHARSLTERLVASFPPPDGGDKPALTASVHGVSGSSMTAELVWDNSGSNNSVTIDWGATDTVDDEEPATGTKTYQYEDAGDYTIVVTDLEDATRTVDVDVTVPFVTGT